MKFISDKQAEEYLQEEENDRSSMIFITAAFIVIAIIVGASDYGVGLIWFQVTVL